jgi:CHAD domain-containing protein
MPKSSNNSHELQEVTKYGVNFIIEHLQILQNCMQDVLRQKDSEDVHDLRVASRRVRVGLSIFSHCLPEKRNQTWQKQIRSLTQAFSKARDLDVQINFLNDFIKQNSQKELTPGIRRVLLRIHQKRRSLQADLTSLLNNFKGSGIITEIQNFLSSVIQPETGSEGTSLSLYQLSCENIHQRLDNFLFFEVFIQYPERIQELHQMRIAAKKLRYTLEVFAPLYKGKMDTTLEIMRTIQTSLGNIRDCDVWLITLPKFLEKERKLINKFYGHPRPYKRLVPGIEGIRSNRQIEREKLYSEFLANWQEYRHTNLWENLRKIIFEPILTNPNQPINHP